MRFLRTRPISYGMKKRRLDEVLIEGGFAADKNSAFVVVTEGRVFVDSQKAVSPSQIVSPDSRIEIKPEKKYVGRGAYKLEAALEKFKISVKGKICIDVGSATGGFTEVLLNRGATKVYAVDTAKGKLALKLRQDLRVIVKEATDIRDIKNLPDKIDIAVIDVSLVSLRNLLNSVGRLLKKSSLIVALFKPQYETRDPKILKHGVIKNDQFRNDLLQDFIKWADANGWLVEDWIESPIWGDKGNIEYLLKFRISKS